MSDRHRLAPRAILFALVVGFGIASFSGASAAPGNGNATPGVHGSGQDHGSAPAVVTPDVISPPTNTSTNLVPNTSSTQTPSSHVVGNGGGANQPCGAYCPPPPGTPPLPSGNGNGNGNATGKPCAGCVGNADSKNPPGQAPNGSDHNNGYECDGNHGIGRTNPAHTGCTPATPPPPPACAATATCPPPPACAATATCPPPPACAATAVCAAQVPPATPGVLPTSVEGLSETRPPTVTPVASSSPAAIPTQVEGLSHLRTGSLPFTGADAVQMGLIAVELVLLGAIAVWLGRRRERQST